MVAFYLIIGRTPTKPPLFAFCIDAAVQLFDIIDLAGASPAPGGIPSAKATTRRTSCSSCPQTSTPSAEPAASKLIDTYVNDSLTAAPADFLCRIAAPACTLRVVDRLGADFDFHCLPCI